jgi:epoxyqueuosine reductase
MNLTALATDIKRWGEELGFQQIGITDTDVGEHAAHLRTWLQQRFHGEMHYMERHSALRREPAALLPGSVRVISARMDYLPPTQANVADAGSAYIARYALGRDYHKLMRKRLTVLAKKIDTALADTTHYRAFVDSAPVLEKALAAKAGLGWIGKHTLLINKNAGSWFFLGEIFTNVPLPVDAPVTAHCGSCSACMAICPTQAIVAPYQLDARLCIAYLTIEKKGPIPLELRRAMGNRIFGCDDCQQVCPWNRYAQVTREQDFYPRHTLDACTLIQLMSWSEATFLQNTEGSAIRRTGFDGWRRNIAIALGNAPYDTAIIALLQAQQAKAPDWLAEHMAWAIQEQLAKRVE